MKEIPLCVCGHACEDHEKSERPTFEIEEGGPSYNHWGKCKYFMEIYDRSNVLLTVRHCKCEKYVGIPEEVSDGKEST